MDNAAPVLSGVPSDLVLTCGIIIPNPANVTAVDDCDMDVEILFEEEQVEGDDCAQSFMIVRTWTAMDDCGNAAVAIQKIEVIDNYAPVLVGVPSDLVLTCGAEIPNPAFVVAVDDCDADVEILLEESIVGAGNCSQSTSIVRTWTATDDCGNMSTSSQRIEITSDDNEAPELLNTLENLEMTYDAFLDWTAPVQLDAVDNCSEISQVMTTSENQDCDNYIVTYSYDATDACGNNAQASFEVRIEDALPSFDVSVPSEIVCGELITINVVDINVENFELTWELTDLSNTWEIVNTEADRIEILAGEETAELNLSIANQLGCASSQVQNLECSIVNSVQNLNAVSLLTLSPNPVSEMLNVNFESSEVLSADIRVYDLLGRTIYQINADINVGQNQFDIQAANFDNGTYILEIATEQGSKVEKFMKF